MWKVWKRASEIFEPYVWTWKYYQHEEPFHHHHYHHLHHQCHHDQIHPALRALLWWAAPLPCSPPLYARRIPRPLLLHCKVKKLTNWNITFKSLEGKLNAILIGVPDELGWAPDCPMRMNASSWGSILIFYKISASFGWARWASLFGTLSDEWKRQRWTKVMLFWHDMMNMTLSATQKSRSLLVVQIYILKRRQLVRRVTSSLTRSLIGPPASPRW